MTEPSGSAAAKLPVAAVRRPDWLPLAIIFGAAALYMGFDGRSTVQDSLKQEQIFFGEASDPAVAKYADLRLKLKAEKDYIGLTLLPRDASPTRLVNRCEFSGRRRAFIRRFKLSRISFRELASAGMIPGVTKSSW